MRSLAITLAIAGVAFVTGSFGSTASAAYAWSTCANENQWCDARGTFTVRYGRHGRYTYRTLSTHRGFMCNNATFGDPLVGVVKHCQIR